MGRHGDVKRREIRRESISMSPLCSFRRLRVAFIAALMIIICACGIYGQSDPGIDTDVGDPVQLRPRISASNSSRTVDGALANIPDAARDLYTRALVAVQAGDHKKAIEQLKKALALYSDFALAWNEL